MADVKSEGDKKGPLMPLKSLSAVKEFFNANDGKLVVISFMQDWAENCTSTRDIILELANEAENKNVGFAEVTAEEHPEICEQHNIVGVPTVLFFRNKKEIDRVVGVRVREVATKLKLHAANNVSGSNIDATASSVAENPETKLVQLNQRLKKLIESADVMVFIKGTPKQPQCGFSRVLVQILDESGLPYESFNILMDEEVRQGLKTYSNWQTYPQVYVKGQLVGGLDIIKELKESGDLLSTLKGEC